jgi:hypothetical protein
MGMSALPVFGLLLFVGAYLLASQARLRVRRLAGVHFLLLFAGSWLLLFLVLFIVLVARM